MLLATDVDVGVDSLGDVTKALEEVLDEAPADIAELVVNSAADVEDLQIDLDGDVAVELETGDGAAVQLPNNPDSPVVLEGADGLVLRVELPGRGDDAEVAKDGSVVYQDAVTDTDVVVQAQANGGARIITVIDGSGAPRAFEFTADLDGAETLTLHPDGSVLVTDSNGIGVYHVPEPWAYDANGDLVPSWYTIAGDTLILNVDHSATNAYPIIADPWWNPFSWNWGRIRDVMAGCASGAARLLILGHALEVPRATALTLATLGFVSSTSGGIIYVGLAVGGCIMGALS